MSDFSFGFFAEQDQNFLIDRNESTDWIARIEKEQITEEHMARVVPLGASVPTLKFEELKFLTYSIYHPSNDSIGEYSNNNDLIPRVYEGGLKLWECTIDLLKTLPNEITCFEDITKISALDLGCGQGLLGIAALILGCSSVTFSDFNDVVLSDTTWPSIVRNCPQQVDKAICYAGDWISLHRQLEQRYDLILTAETSYSTESCEKSIYFIEKHLSLHGMAFIATKRFYFGVGGGSASIEELINRFEHLRFELRYSFEDGHSNVRDIYKITCKH